MNFRTLKGLNHDTYNKPITILVVGELVEMCRRELWRVRGVAIYLEKSKLH